MVASNIIITGASSGLGKALALEYAANGVVLGLVGRDDERLDEVARECFERGASVMTAVIDVCDSEMLSSWLLEFDDQYPVDLCIANAGVSAGTGGGFEGLDQIHHLFNININGVANTLHPLTSRMIGRNKGHLAIVSSVAGFRGSPTAPAYSTSKAAVRVYGQALRGLLAPEGVNVSVICPGFIKTPMTKVNPFPMPFIMNSDKAARIIRRGLKRNKGLIVFPWQMAILARLQNMLPDALINRIYRSVPAKPAE